MTDVVGKAIYEADVDTSKLSSSLNKADAQIRDTGAATERAFGAQAGAGIGRFGGFVDTLKGKVGGLGQALKSPEVSKGLLQGIGIGGGLLAFNSMEGAVKGAVDMLGDFVKAGAASQVAEAKLGASLNANVPDWQAHTSEIDAAARAGQKLGFTNNETENSLAGLVLHTHDVTKALDVQRVAMDLARFKGIDLATASLALGKAYDGSTTALKKMGIEIPKGVKGLDAIGRAQKAVAGQADTFAKTFTGSQEALAASIEGVKEKLGQTLMPVFQGVVDFISGPVIDALDALLSGLGNVGTAFDNLHRLIDPNYALLQDTSTALRDQAKALGLNYDAVVQFTAAQKLAVLQQQASALANAKNAIATEIQNHLTDDQILLAGKLTDEYQKYGVTANDVAVIQQQVHDGTYQATTAQQQNTQAVADADKQIAAYELSVAQAQRRQQEMTLHTHQLTAAGDAHAAALKKQSDDMAAYGKLTADNAKKTNIWSTGLGGLTGSLTDLGVPLDPLQQALGGVGHVLTDVRHQTGATAHDMRNFDASWRGDWINVVNRIDLSAGSIHDVLVGMKKDTNQQLTQLEYDLAHPHQKEHTLAYLVKAMKRAQADLIKAENSGDADLIKEAQTAVADIQAEYDKLNGSVTLTTHFAWKGGEGTGGGQRGRTGVRASGGPIWPGDWIVGERGPERMRITPSGTGYVWPNSGSQRVGSAQTVNHTGTILIRVDGTNLPAGVTNEGLGAAIGATVSQAHLRTIGPRQYA